MKQYEIGDLVVYSMAKVSTRPGQHAQQVHPSIRGESYEYTVEKYWAVTDLPGDGQIEITTRRGKKRQLRTDDPRLRPASWFEKRFQRRRFPEVELPLQRQAAS